MGNLQIFITKMSRVRSKINRGECLTACELATLENLPDQEILIYIKVLGKIMHRTVLSKLKKIQSVRKSAKDEAEKQRLERRLEQIESDKEEARKQNLLIGKSLPDKLAGGHRLTKAELEYLDTLEIIKLRNLSTKYKADMHPNALRKMKDIFSSRDSPEVGRHEQKSLAKNGWSRLEGRAYKK